MIKAKKTVFFVLTMAAITAILATGAWAIKVAYTSQEIAEIKTQQLIESANEDLLNSFQFDDNYLTFTTFDISEIAQVLDIDADTALDIAAQLDALYANPPIGSTEPLYVVKKDLTELYVLYKEEDGTNVEESAIKNQLSNAISKSGNGWTVNHKEADGAPILDFAEISVDD